MIIFVDADAFIALINQNDALHERALKVLHSIGATKHIKIFTSWDVVSEVATKLSYGISKQASREFLQFLDENDISIVYPEFSTAMKARKLFVSITSKRVSLTDCSNIIHCQALYANAIFSFDRIYPKHQVQLLEDMIQ